MLLRSELSSLFTSDNQSHILALLAEGKFDSLFSGNILAGTPLEKQMYAYLPSSIIPSQIIVVADSDLLVAENWADTTETVNNPVYGLTPIYDNGSFILRAVDFLTEKNKLLGLKNKEKTTLKTVGEAVYDEVFNRHAEEYNLLQEELNSLTAEIQGVEKTLTPSSTDTARKIEENTNKISKIKRELKQKEYLIKRENEQQLSNIVTINTIFIPLLLIILIALIAVWLRRRRFKLVKEIINESPSD